MTEIRQTDVFRTWFYGLRDMHARARINAPIRRIKLGNFGGVKPVGEGVSELRIPDESGYRVVCLVQRGWLWWPYSRAVTSARRVRTSS